MRIESRLPGNYIEICEDSECGGQVVCLSARTYLEHTSNSLTAEKALLLAEEIMRLVKESVGRKSPEPLGSDW